MTAHFNQQRLTPNELEELIWLETMHLDTSIIMTEEDDNRYYVLKHKLKRQLFYEQYKNSPPQRISFNKFRKYSSE